MTLDEGLEKKNEISDAVQEHQAINMAALGIWIHKALVVKLQPGDSVPASASCPVSDETLLDKTEVYDVTFLTGGTTGALSIVFQRQQASEGHDLVPAKLCIRECMTQIMFESFSVLVAQWRSRPFISLHVVRIFGDGALHTAPPIANGSTGF